MARSRGMFILAGLAFLASGRSPAATVATVVNNGDPARRIDMVILGDRYTAGEMDKFRNDVNLIVAQFQSQSPWKEYWSYINVHRVEVVSPSNTEAGPLGSNLTNGRCWFANTTAVNNYAATAPDNEIRYVLVNSTTYGGCATYGGIAVGYNGSTTNTGWVAVHETGHQFGLLADEYNYGGGDTYTGGEPSEPNATTNLNRSTTKWARWIDAATPIPTPTSYTTSVGLFDGCKYWVHGISRPKNNCMMKALYQPNCEVCREQVVKRFYAMEGNPVDGIVSSSGSFSVPKNGTTSLTVAEIAPHALGYSWYVDGAPKGSGSALTFNGADYATGSHTVKIVVTDLTPFVRGAALNGSYERAISVTTATTTSPIEAIRVSATSLNVLSGLGTGYAILGALSSGRVVIAAEKLASGWHRIWYEGKTGYVSSTYVLKATGVQAVKINTSILNVRTGAGTGYTKIGEAHLGEMYAIEGSASGWYQIRWSGAAAGWVSGGYVVIQGF